MKKKRLRLYALSRYGKLFRVMKLCALLLFVAFTQVHATGYGQEHFTINADGITVKKAIREIEKSSGYSVFYRTDQVDLEKKINIHVSNASIDAVMRLLLKEQALTYRVVNNTTIVIKPASESPADRVLLQTISGVITDSATQKPLAGVTVEERGTGNATMSNEKGAYVITVQNEEAVLEFRSIGYRTRSVKVGTQSVIHMSLAEETRELNEVVVVGFGTQRKSYLTGSISQVSAKEMENRPVNNIGQALQGLVPNLNVTNSNGSPNAAPALNIRGGTSFFKDVNDGGKMKFSSGAPFTLVDGVEMDINSLNPEDIESISVLKDAASAAIYGARAAYGVILVTTKKGKKGDRTNVTYSNMFQWNKPSAVPDLLNAVDIQQAVVDAYALTRQNAPADALTLLDSIKAYAADPLHHNPYYMNGSNIIWNANTSPYEEAVRNWAPLQKHNLSLSGGSNKTTYYASLGYFGQQGMYKLNTDKFHRYNFMLNVSSKVTDWFTVDFKSSYNRSLYSAPVNPDGKGGWWRAMSQEPGRNVFMPLKTPANAPVPNAYTDNILSFMDYGSRKDENSEIFLLTVSPTITPVKNWNIKADISYRDEAYNTKTFVPLLSRIEFTWTNPTTVYTSPTFIAKDQTNLNHYTINAYTDYTLNIAGNHHLYGLVGFNQELEKSDYLYGRGNDILTPSVPVISQTSGEKNATDAESHWAIRGAFYRFTYDYKGKYLLGSNGRYDGTSKFPADRRFKMFPTISAGWRISEEAFARGVRDVVTDLKLRASYGSLGNQNVRNYIYVPFYGTIQKVDQIFGGIRPVGVTSPGLVDQNITWETATTLDWGFDMTLFRKLDLNFSRYDRTTTDILVDGDKLPAVLGTSVPTKNSGTLKTKGFDLQATWKDVTKGGLQYSVSFVLSDYKTRITKFDGNPNLLLNNLYASQTAGEIWGYETYGIFRDSAEIAGAPRHNLVHSGIIYPGDVRFKDLSGNDTISSGQNTLTNHGDLKVIGNSTPRFSFGLNTFLAWKHFDMNVFFQGIGKRDVYITDNLFWGAINGGIGTYEVYQNSWSLSNPDGFYPAYKNRASNITTQTRYLQNAAYLRLKNLTIGYTVPAVFSERIWMKKIRVSASAYNIWQYSKVPAYFDPEVLSANYPMLKSVAVGVQVTF
ncbi:TonB-dependent receptor [Niabella pedocola]|uniref:TonB-dependent receptor n=1 Tax=Niabella pedocola TaxID=1752077 RepID=A0ABS8PXZ4_9BACT|nr:TonB-dependent receptor [Niabella pedocola]MCD2425213.1 TonB-dependent receptor [Niabella pedocola]